MTEEIWSTLWQDIRNRVDARNDRRLTLTVEEIRSLTGTWRNIDEPFWWETMAGHPVIAAVPLENYGLRCEPRILGNRVYAVTFMRPEC
jgi:hypothetical protein